MVDHPDIRLNSTREPQNVREYNERGWVWLTQGEFTQAESDFHQAIQKNSRFAEAYYGLGIALKLQNKLQESRSAFEKALSFLGKDSASEDRIRNTMLRRLAEDHLKIIDGLA